MSFARTTIALLALTHLVTAALAGPLDPPPGPIASTQKLLAEVEPRTAVNAVNTPGDASSLFRITQPGSYYLTQDIIGIPGRNGIHITASNVSLDLNGFRMFGGDGTLDGVVINVGSIAGVEVRNGTINRWGGNGVDCASGSPEACILRDLRVSASGGAGLRIGPAGLVTNCTSRSNLGAGIFASFGAIVTDCIAIDNADDGIAVGAGCTITACTAYSNDGDGLSAGTGSAVSANTSRGNGRHGIRATGSFTIVGNTCSNNGQGADPGAGIFVSAGNGRIESNHCTFQDRGIEVAAGANIIIRNTCASNTTNWEIAANNYYGPIINRSGVATAAVSGNSAAETLNSTHPNANFTY